VTFTAIPYSPGGGDITYDWKHNDYSFKGYNQTVTLDELEPGDWVSCEITVTNSANFSSATAFSNIISVSDLPDAGEITVVAGDNVIEVGETITLISTEPGGIWGCQDDIVTVDLTTGVVTGINVGTATVYYGVPKVSTCYDYGMTGFQITVTAASQINTQTFTSDGTFTVPEGVTEINIKAWGGSGGGSYRYVTNDTDPENMIYGPGAGGGGGGFCGGTIHVTPGEILDITVGTGGYGGNDLDAEGSTGGDSEVRDYSGTWWITAFGGSGGFIVSEGAEGGSGGNGSYYPTTLNFTTYNGGNGSAGVLSENGVGYGGGGGGGAGDSQNGSDAIKDKGGAGGNSFGGMGGDSGNDGATYGGGGGGANNEEYPSVGNGANGAVIISWNPATPSVTITSSDEDNNICFRRLGYFYSNPT
jgi:hypothetical protein